MVEENGKERMKEKGRSERETGPAIVALEGGGRGALAKEYGQPLEEQSMANSQQGSGDLNPIISRN